MSVAPGETVELRLRLWSPTEGDPVDPAWPANKFEEVMAQREAEADEFYAAIAPKERTAEEIAVMRQAFAGMIWTKQFYRYDVKLWLDGDPQEPPPPPGHAHIRNQNWRHLDAYDVLSMPDAWSTCGLRFGTWHSTVVFAHIDPEYASTNSLSCCASGTCTPTARALPTSGPSTTAIHPSTLGRAAGLEIDGSRDFNFSKVCSTSC